MVIVFYHDENSIDFFRLPKKPLRFLPPSTFAFPLKAGVEFDDVTQQPQMYYLYQV